MYYKLYENKNVIPLSAKEWIDFIENTNPTHYTHVGDDLIDGKRVSTVFIGLCNNVKHRGGVTPVFETMVFEGDKSYLYIEHYSTRKEAEEGHQRAIQWVKDGCKDDK